MKKSLNAFFAIITFVLCYQAKAATHSIFKPDLIFSKVDDDISATLKKLGIYITDKDELGKNVGANINKGITTRTFNELGTFSKFWNNPW